MAFRTLRDLIRDIPIGPSFLYGDVARGVIRLALRRDVRERTGAIQLAAALEEIASRSSSDALASQSMGVLSFPLVVDVSMPK